VGVQKKMRFNSCMAFVMYRSVLKPTSTSAVLDIQGVMAVIYRCIQIVTREYTNLLLTNSKNSIKGLKLHLK